MCPLKIVLLYLSYWWGLIKSFSFCYCWSEGTPGGSNTCILCCSDPFLLGARWPWAAEKLQAQVRNRETPRKPEEKEVSDQIKFSCSVGESENSKRRILSPRGGNCACPGVRSACGFGCLVHAGLMWDCLDGTTGLHTLCLEQGVWARQWLVPVLLLAIFGSADDHRAGRAEGKNTNHFQCVTSLSSHREVSNGVFTLSPAYIFACISSASHPTQNQPFLGQHHPAFSGSVSGNGVTSHIWVTAVGKQLRPHKSLVITTSSY